MEYPFEFKELLLTNKVLDILGFSEYWAGASEYGERAFGKKISENQYESWYRIVENDEMDDPTCGYGGGEPEYSSCHYSHPFGAKSMGSIYFLHELYESIAENSPDVLGLFVEKTKEKGVNMYPYIKSWIEYKTTNLLK